MDLLESKISWARAFGYAALISLGFLIAFGLLGMIGPVSFGKDAPAWVQAVGSIAAILIAVAVPAVQHWLASKAHRNESLDRARSLGLQLLPHIQGLASRNDDVWQHENPDDGSVELRGENVCLVGFWAQSAIEIPPEISAETHRLHELGPAASGLQRAIFNIGAAREMINYVPVIRPINDGGDCVDDVEHTVYDMIKFYDLLWDALQGLTESQNRIEAFFRHGTRPVQKRG